MNVIAAVYARKSTDQLGLTDEQKSVTRQIEHARAYAARKGWRVADDCASGVGIRRIAIILNDEGAPAPTPRRVGRPRSWAPSTVREILYRDLYRGVVVWNQIRKRDVWGLKRYLARPEDQWMRRDAPELRVVDDALWAAAHRRIEDARASYLWSTNGKLNGRAPAVKATESKYLLTGFAQCAVYGGSLMARSRDYGSQRKFGYLCGYHHQRGRTVCVNGLEVPMDSTDCAVLASIERDLLRREVVERAIEFAIDELRPGTDPAERRRDEILTEIRRLDAELSRLTAAIASGGDLPALLAALKERQAQRERCERALIELDARSRVGRTELPRLEREIRHRLADWRAMLRREVPEAREILRNLVVGRIVFTPRPEARVYEFSGRGRSDDCWLEPPVQFRW